MEATFVLDTQDDRRAFAERLSTFFADKIIRVHVEEVQRSGSEQHQLLMRMQVLRERTAQVTSAIPPGRDINDIIDDTNDTLP